MTRVAAERASAAAALAVPPVVMKSTCTRRRGNNDRNVKRETDREERGGKAHGARRACEREVQSRAGAARGRRAARNREVKIFRPREVNAHVRADIGPRSTTDAAQAAGRTRQV